MGLEMSIERNGEKIQLTESEIYTVWHEYEINLRRNEILEYIAFKNIQISPEDVEKAVQYYIDLYGETEDWTAAIEWAINTAKIRC